MDENTKDALDLANIRYDRVFSHMKSILDSYHNGLLTDEEFAHSMGLYRDALISVEAQTIMNMHRVWLPVSTVND